MVASNPPSAPKYELTGELWAGLAAMLVALPSAMAYGLVAYAPLGDPLAASGALAGLVGAVLMGLVAPLFGGTPRLVSAPCAPAAAVLATVSAQSAAGSGAPILALTLVAALAGALQIGFSVLKGGRLIKYIPYPVVAGYLSGVGLLIFFGQLPSALGLAKGAKAYVALTAPSEVQLRAVLIAAVAITVMVLAPRITKALPGPILALGAAMLAYLGFAAFDHRLFSLEGNSLVLGSFGDASVGAVGARIIDQWSALPAFVSGVDATALVGSAATLAVLLSIDTLKTCVVLDAMTRSRHDSNRELRGQGIANLCSSIVGGMPGAGTMGATLVNLNSGGKTRRSAMAVGGFAALALVLLAPFIAWIPTAGLAGILLVVGLRMIDTHTFALARDRNTLLDFTVICAVVLTALVGDLLTAAGVGVGLAVVLFLREQIRGSVVRRRIDGGNRFSKKRRLPHEIQALDAAAVEVVALELQGNLFFGTSDQLFTELEGDLKRRKYVILDLRRVGTVDFTAVRMLEQIAAILAERGGKLVLANVPVARATGQNLEGYLASLGLAHNTEGVRLEATFDEALAWVEDQILRERLPPRGGLDAALELNEIELFRAAPPELLIGLASLVREQRFERGDVIFRAQDAGDEIHFVRRGYVRIELGLEGNRRLHLATFGPGDHFGELAFIDRQTRSADAVARSEVLLYSLSRDAFDRAASDEPRLLQVILGGLARALSMRLRLTDRELQIAVDS